SFLSFKQREQAAGALSCLGASCAGDLRRRSSCSPADTASPIHGGVSMHRNLFTFDPPSRSVSTSSSSKRRIAKRRLKPQLCRLERLEPRALLHANPVLDAEHLA